jgi:transcriptional regulator with XRE-family HTH domain
MQREDTTKLTMRVGRRVVEIREILELSQSQFAAEVGISRGYLSDIERGVREMSLETFDKICSTYGVRPNELFGFVSLAGGGV